MAQVFDRSGAPVPATAGLGTRIFLVPATDVQWSDNWNSIGLKATNSGGFRFTDQFVPHGYSIGRDYISEVRLPAPLYKFPLNGLFAFGFSAVALGLARAMLDAVIALAKEKRPYLAKQSMLESHLGAVSDRRGGGAAALGPRLSSRAPRTASGKASWHPAC